MVSVRTKHTEGILATYHKVTECNLFLRRNHASKVAAKTTRVVPQISLTNLPPVVLSSATRTRDCAPRTLTLVSRRLCFRSAPPGRSSSPVTTRASRGAPHSANRRRSTYWPTSRNRPVHCAWPRACASCLRRRAARGSAGERPLRSRPGAGVPQRGAQNRAHGLARSPDQRAVCGRCRSCLSSQLDTLDSGRAAHRRKTRHRLKGAVHQAAGPPRGPSRNPRQKP